MFPGGIPICFAWVDLCNWHIPIHPVNMGLFKNWMLQMAPIYGWRWIKSPVFMAVYGGFPHIRQSNVAGNSPIYGGFTLKTPVGWWSVRGLYYPLYIGDYNNPRTGNPVNQYFILYDRGVLNTAHLITFPSRTGALWPMVPWLASRWNQAMPKVSRGAIWTM